MSCLHTSATRLFSNHFILREACELVDDEGDMAFLEGREGVESLWCRDLFTLHVYTVNGVGFVLKSTSDPDSTVARLKDVVNRHEIRRIAFIKKKVEGERGLSIECAMFEMQRSGGQIRVSVPGLYEGLELTLKKHLPYCFEVKLGRVRI